MLRLLFMKFFIFSYDKEKTWNWGVVYFEGYKIVFDIFLLGSWNLFLLFLCYSNGFLSSTILSMYLYEKAEGLRSFESELNGLLLKFS